MATATSKNAYQSLQKAIARKVAVEGAVYPLEYTHFMSPPAPATQLPIMRMISYIFLLSQQAKVRDNDSRVLIENSTLVVTDNIEDSELTEQLARAYLTLRGEAKLNKNTNINPKNKSTFVGALVRYIRLWGDALNICIHVSTDELDYYLTYCEAEADSEGLDDGGEGELDSNEEHYF